MASPTRDLPAVLVDYERHLVSERDLAPHTVRAYLSDVAGLLDHADRLGHTDLAELDLRTLRSWLAHQQVTGRSRTTLARRATAVRVFTAWLARTGRIPADVGASLRSPKAHQTLPPVLRQDEARDLVTAAAHLADDGSPSGLRDIAMLEVLYATGVRVGELFGLDIDDLDQSRRVARVLGKGRKERTVPYGQPAAEALEVWLSRGRPSSPRPVPVGALSRRAGRPHRPAGGAHTRAPAHRRRARRSGHRSARPAAHRSHPPPRGRCRPQVGPGAARSRLPGHDAALHARDDRSASQGLPTGAPARLSSSRATLPSRRRRAAIRRRPAAVGPSAQGRHG